MTAPAEADIPGGLVPASRRRCSQLGFVPNVHSQVG
jgi:hypothetical protein